MQIKQKVRHALYFNSGPHIRPANLIGFHVHLNLPGGGSNFGSTFGSFRPGPTGLSLAYLSGTSSKDINNLPVS